MRAGFVRVLGVALLATMLIASPARAAVVDAGGFIAGPRITSTGLLWLTPAAQMLTTSGGDTEKLTGGIVPVTSPSSNWVALAGPRGVEAGRLGQTLTPVAALHRCPPFTESSLGSRSEARLDPLLAITGSILYALVDPACLRARSLAPSVLVAVSLRSGGLHVVAPIPAHNAVALAAAGSRLAVSYASTAVAPPNEEPQVTLTTVVMGSRRGRAAYETSTPLGGVYRLGALDTQVDADGDVLVTDSSTAAGPISGSSAGWWASPADPSGQSLEALSGGATVIEGLPNNVASADLGAAALSAGQIAYLTGAQYYGEQIHVLTIATGATRTVAEFPGVVHVEGLDLSGNELAWAQQSGVPVSAEGPAPNGGHLFTCTEETIGPHQLTSLDLRYLRSAPIIVGPPLPAADEPPCTSLIV